MAGKNEPFYQEDFCQIIGVAGTARGVGVTHFCILTANYLSGFFGKKTAVLEWNDHQDFARMEKVCTGKETTDRSFSVLDVQYYKSAGQGELISCMEAGYQYIIVDFGIFTEEKQGEFLRCGRRVLAGSFSEWQSESFFDYLKDWNRLRRSWTCVVSFGNEESQREVRKKYRVPVLRIPFAEDAFAVTPIILKFFRHFFEN